MSLPQYEGCIYLDYNATTPIFPEVSAAMQPFTSSCFGNPSSPHVFAAPCRTAIKTARQQVAELINVPAGDCEECIIFTSCGTEADNMAINMALQHFKSGRQQQGEQLLPHIVTCAIEHPAILLYLQTLTSRGEISLTVLPVDEQGFVDPAEVASALQPQTACVSIMHSNNEVGTIQPMREISRLVAEYNCATGSRALLHTDAAQSIGKVPIDVAAMGADLLTLVGHKYGAPKGVAALFVRKGVQAAPMLIGGGQERGRRAGTENVMLIAALGEASRIARHEACVMLLSMLALKKRLIELLIQGLGADLLRFNGPRRSVDPGQLQDDLHLLRIILAGGAGRSSKGTSTDLNSASLLLEQLPNTISVSFRDVKVSDLMPLLVRSVACSAGSACHSDSTHISPVLSAMRVPDEFALGTLRLSLGRHTTKAEVDTATGHIVRAVKSLL